jgi:hypothetical protein
MRTPFTFDSPVSKNPTKKPVGTAADAGKNNKEGI